MNRKSLDAAFPTVVRYLGVIFAITYVAGRFVGVELPDSIVVLATGMFLFKNVASNGNGEKKESTS